MAKLGEKSQSSSSTTSPSEEGELSICFSATAESWGIGSFTEWYVFNISNNDFKYKQEKLPKVKRRQFGDDIRCVLEERICVEGHHHRGDGIYGMRKLTPVSTLKRYSEESLVALGSTVYCFGRESDGKLDPFTVDFDLNQPMQGITEFFCLDLNNPSEGWKNVTPLIARRSKPDLVVLDGKIYAFSGVDPDGCEPWAEFYDSILGEWETLPEPPSRRSIDRLIAVDAPKKIVVTSYDHPNPGVYVYDVATKSWEEVVNCWLCDLNLAYRIPKVVVVGHTLYWSIHKERKSKIYAYDLDQGMWFLGHIRGLESNYRSLKHGSCFLHLGGDKFCFLWLDIVPNCDSDSDSEDEYIKFLVRTIQQSQLHCVKLRVSIDMKEKFTSEWSDSTSSLSVTVESCQSYFIDHDISSIEALLLDGTLGKEEQLDEESAIGREVVKVAEIEKLRPQMAKKKQFDIVIL